MAPRILNLARLAELAGLELTPDVLDLLADMNVFQIEGRYPDRLAPVPTPEEAKRYILRAQEVFQWLLNQF